MKPEVVKAVFCFIIVVTIEERTLTTDTISRRKIDQPQSVHQKIFIHISVIGMVIITEYTIINL